MGIRLSEHLDENVTNLNEILNLDSNFDIIRKGITIAGRDACIYFIDGFCKDDVMQKMLQYFIELKEEDMPSDAEAMAGKHMPYGEIDLADEWEQVLYAFFSGVFLLLVDGYEKIILIDARTYPARSVDEPDDLFQCRRSK